MAELLKKKHYGKTWSQTPSTTVYNIHIQNSKLNDQEGDYSLNSNDVHRLIFHLPIKYLRSGATSISEFKKNAVILPFMDAFCFYLNFIEELYINGSTQDPNFKRDQIKLFLEDVKDVKGHNVALRFHLFIQCKYSLIKDLKTKILDEHGKKLRKRKRTIQKKHMEFHENYTEIYDDFTWSKMVSAYKMKSDCMENAYRMYSSVTGDNNELESQMNGVFGVETSLFQGNILNSENKSENIKICEAQKNFDNYIKHEVKVSTTNTYTGEKYSCYVFPCEEDVVMVHPTEVFIKEIFGKQKYLPFYFRDKVLLPKIEVGSCIGNNTISMNNTPHVIFKVPKNHINIHINFIKYGLKNINIIKYLENECITKEETTEFIMFGINPVNKDMIKKNVKDFFQVCELNEHVEQDYISFNGNKSFYSYQKKYMHVGLEFISLFSHNGNMMIEDPMERAALTDKNTLDSLDFLKYEAIILKKVYKDEDLQDLLFRRFKHDVVENPYAIVSEPLRIILDWGMQHKTHHIKRKKYKDWNDEDGMWKHENIFINSMNWKMDVFDNDLQVATGHSSLMMLHHSKYDAYRQTMDLHMNIIFTGEGATSKSFLFEKMRQMSIPATVVELTYQTSKADAIDGDRNDTITVFNEAPAGLFMTNKHTDPGDEARFKEKLTSQRVSCKTYEKDDETGLRTNRTTISQSIGVYMGATNDDPADATEAMRTRFYFGQFEKSERKNKSMDACMQGEKMWNEIGEDLLQETMNDFHMEHYRMALLFKLMYIGAISYPTLTTSDIVFMKMSDKLRKMKLNTSTRFKERYDILCRIYTMINAIDLIFNYEVKEFVGCKCQHMDEDGDLCINNAVFYKTGEDTPSYCLHHGIKETYEVLDNSNLNCCIPVEDEDECYEDVLFSCGEHYVCMKHKNHVIKSCIDGSKYGECGVRCSEDGCKHKAQYMDPQNNKPSHCIEHRKKGMVLFGNHCGMDFDIRQLRDVEPLLYCTEEIAVFAFTQLSLEVYNPSENKVINAMYELWKQKGSQYHSINKDDNKEIDYNISIIKLSNTRQLTKMLSTNIPIQYGRPSDHNIKMVLKELSTRNTSHTPYVQCNTSLIKPFCLNDFGSTYLQVVNDLGNMEINQQTKIITDCFNIIDREIQIATELFKNPRLKDGKKKQMEVDKYASSGYEESEINSPLQLTINTEDVLSESVNEIQHEYTKEKYVMFGLPYRDVHGTINRPNKFHFKKIGPKQKQIKMKNPIFKTNESLIRRQRRDIKQQEQNVGENILMDLNSYAAISHSEKLNPPKKFIRIKNQVKMKQINQKRREKNEEVKKKFLDRYGSEIFEKKYVYVDKPIMYVNENASYIDKIML